MPSIPYGYGKYWFFWSFLAAVFVLWQTDCTRSTKGFTTLIHPGQARSFLANYIVLGLAFAFEAASLAVAVREFSRLARARRCSF